MPIGIQVIGIIVKIMPFGIFFPQFLAICGLFVGDFCHRPPTAHAIGSGNALIAQDSTQWSNITPSPSVINNTTLDASVNDDDEEQPNTCCCRKKTTDTGSHSKQ